MIVVIQLFQRVSERDLVNVDITRLLCPVDLHYDKCSGPVAIKRRCAHYYYKSHFNTIFSLQKN